MSECRHITHQVPDTDTLVVSRLYQFAYGSVTYASCRIIDGTLESLLIVGISHETHIGHDILYLLALIETQSAIDAIRHTVLEHLFLEGTALRIGAVEDSKIGVLHAEVLHLALDVTTHVHRLLTVAAQL